MNSFKKVSNDVLKFVAQEVQEMSKEDIKAEVDVIVKRLQEMSKKHPEIVPNNIKVEAKSESFKAWKKETHKMLIEVYDDLESADIFYKHVKFDTTPEEQMQSGEGSSLLEEIADLKDKVDSALTTLEREIKNAEMSSFYGPDDARRDSVSVEKDLELKNLESDDLEMKNLGTKESAMKLEAQETRLEGVVYYIPDQNTYKIALNDDFVVNSVLKMGAVGYKGIRFSGKPDVEFSTYGLNDFSLNRYAAGFFNELECRSKIYKNVLVLEKDGKTLASFAEFPYGKFVELAALVSPKLMEFGYKIEE